MRTLTPSGSIDCYLIVPPQYRPQLFCDPAFKSGTNLRAVVTFTERKNENRIALASGRTDVFQLGSTRRDVQLTITGADEATEMVIDEIVERNIPVYIYPRSGPGLQLNLPLVRGTGVDPLDATVTLTFTTSTGTTVYMPKGDAGHGVYLEALDLTAPLTNGVYRSNGELTGLPSGRGFPFPKKRTNSILDSLISAITYEAPYAAGSEWGAYTSAADVWGTDHGIKTSPWCDDANSYWTTSTTTTLRSYDFTTNLWMTTEKSLSFCYRLDGTMNIALKDSGGTTRYSANITSGSGRAYVDLTGAGASYFGAYMVVSLTAGNYCEFSCPQIIDDNTLDSSEYLPFIGTASGSARGAVTNCRLKVEHDMAADAVPFTTTAANRDGVLLISGYCQPMFGPDYVSPSIYQTVVQAVGYDTSIKLNIGYDGSSDLEWALFYDGVERAVVAMDDHRRGDVYAFGLWSGYADGTANTQMRIVRLSDGTVFRASYIGSMVTCRTLYVGSDSASAQSDCVVSAVTVEAADQSNCASLVDRLAHDGARNIFRSTIGRWYTLSRGTSPRPQMSEVSQGVYTGTEVRAI